MISNFTILILTHFISDWFFQLDKWGAKKRKVLKYLFYHSIQYAIIFIPILYFLEINLLWTIWLFITHLALDNYKFIETWNKYIKRVKPQYNLPPWYTTVQDQILHIIVLIPIII